MTSDQDTAPEPDLGLLFATNSPDLRAVRIFVDRIPEQQAFDRAVRAHLARTREPGFDAQDVLAPRRNALVYFGVGGVGKTSLSQKLEQRHASPAGPAPTDWPAWDPGFARSVTARVDLASESGFDLERVLLSIRLAVAPLGRPMHAFDIALSRYWENVHPNESIREFLRRDTRLSRVAQAMRLPDQVAEGVKDVVQSLGGVSSMVSVGGQLAKMLVGGVQGSVVRRHAVQGCRRLGPMLEAKADLENLSFYAHLLAWDLAEAARQRGHDFHLAVFLDTFEDVANGEQRRLEQMLSRLVWLMPNVLFVISSRNRLDWGDDDAAGRLDRAGPVAWPGLTPGADTEPSQHLVGNLSDEDSRRFLRDRLQRGGSAVIPSLLREQIAHESGGYPLYLDLAVSRYLQLGDAGAALDADDFSGGFPALVTRILRDLEPDERLIVRVVTLLDSFDSTLAAAIAGLPSEAVARRLADRAFVDVDDGAPFPYSVHRLLRTEIRQADTGLDAFTSADWARYAARAFDALGGRFRAAGGQHDRATLISLLNQALRLADEFDLPLGWTNDAAYAFISDSIWESGLRPLVRVPAMTAAAALAQTLLAITDRQVAGRQHTASVLTSLLATGLLSGDGADLATYYAAESLRESGRGNESAALLGPLLAGDSRISDLAAKGTVHQLRRAGRFVEALDLVRSRPESAMWTQMAGTLFWSQGMFAEAEAAYHTSQDRFLADGRPGHAAEVAGCLAFVSGLHGIGPGGGALVEAGQAALRQSRHIWGRLMAELGVALLGADGGESTARRLAALERDGDTAGLTSIQAYAVFGRCLNAALSGNDGRLVQARAELVDGPVKDFRWLVEVVDIWLGAEPAAEAASDWIGGAAVAAARWRDLVAVRRSALGWPEPDR